MHPSEMFLTLHAHVHAAATSGEHGPSLEDGLCDGLTDAQMRGRPDGFNSIVWLLWHITRFEDVVVNTVLRGVPEVLDRDGWQERLGVGTRLAGTGSSDEEVEEFSQQVDPSAVRAYRAAVGRETRQWAVRRGSGRRPPISRPWQPSPTCWAAFHKPLPRWTNGPSGCGGCGRTGRGLASCPCP